MQRARLIYNPTAGRTLITKRLPELLEMLEKAGLETSCRATQEPWDAAREADLAAQRGFDVVIAAGGDGTIHEVVNGLARHAHTPKLGIIPCGTTNDVGRTLNLPKDFGEACQVIGSGKSKPMDIGKCGERYFLSVAAAGIFTEVTYEAPSRLKTVMGPIAYYAKAVEKLGSLYKPFPLELTTPERQWSFDEVMLLVVANGKSIGGFEQLAPLAVMDDGLLDVLVIPKISLPELLHIVSLVHKGEHLQDSRVIYFQTHQFQVKTSAEMKLNLDGEWGGSLNGTMEVLPQKLQVFVPNGRKEEKWV